MKNKKKTKNFKMQPKSALIDKGTIKEFLYMLPKDVCVRDLLGALVSFPEDKKEIWVELDMMEVVLETDSLVFENMMDTFDTPLDQELIQKLSVKTVYAFNYNTKDEADVKTVLKEIHQAFGGFVASDTEDLEPTYTVDTFIP